MGGSSGGQAGRHLQVLRWFEIHIASEGEQEIAVAAPPTRERGALLGPNDQARPSLQSISVDDIDGD
jgi:hypothetical protein